MSSSVGSDSKEVKTSASVKPDSMHIAWLGGGYSIVVWQGVVFSARDLLSRSVILSASIRSWIVCLSLRQLSVGGPGVWWNL